MGRVKFDQAEIFIEQTGYAKAYMKIVSMEFTAKKKHV